MKALLATEPRPDDPLAAAAYTDHADPQPPPGWVRVAVRAASVNRHDLWTLQGVGISGDAFPMVLGCDGAGTLTDPAGGLGPGTPVVIYPVVADATLPDETMDPRRSLLSEVHPGTFAEQVAVPARNVLPLPEGLSFEQAATLGCTYLTAYRMLFTRSGLAPGDTMLVQGATGGVSTALIQLGRAAGMRVWVTGRSETGRARATSLGAHRAFGSDERLPGKVDAVFETVGSATWKHSMRAVRPGGVVVCSGSTTGADPSANLQRLFFLQISVIGSTMGTLDELRRLIAFCAAAGVSPVVDRSIPLADGASALRAKHDGEPGKFVLTV